MIRRIGRNILFYVCPHWVALWPWKFVRKQMVWYGMGLDPGEILQCRICGTTAERPTGIQYERDIFVHEREDASK